MNIQKFANKLEEKLNKKGMSVEFYNIDSDSRYMKLSKQDSTKSQFIQFSEILNQITPESHSLEDTYDQLKNGNDKKEALKDFLKLFANTAVNEFYKKYIKNSIPVFISKDAIADDMFTLSFQDFFNEPISGDVDFEVAFSFNNDYIKNEDVTNLHLDDNKEVITLVKTQNEEYPDQEAYYTNNDITILTGQVKGLLNHLQQNTQVAQLFAIPSSQVIAYSLDLDRAEDMQKAVNETYKKNPPDVGHTRVYPVSSHIFIYDGNEKSIRIYDSPELEKEDEEIEEEM